MARFRRPTLPLMAVLCATATCASTSVAQTPLDATAPTLVTMHRQNAPLKVVVEELAKQAQLPVRFFGDPRHTVTVDVDGKPFWEVLVDVCQQSTTGFSMNGTGDRDRVPELVVQNQPLGKPVTAGAVVAQFLNVRHWSRLTEAPETREHCEIDVDLTWEPKLNVLFYERVAVPAEATDDAGHSLVPTGDPNVEPGGVRYYRPYGIYDVRRDLFGGNRVRQVIKLKVGPDTGRTIAKLRGSVRLFVGGAPKAIEFKNLKQAAKSKPALPFTKDTTITLTDATVGDERVEMELFTLKNPGENEEAWSRRKALLSACTVHVVDADGKEWQSAEARVENSFSTDRLFLLVNAERRAGVKTAPATVTLTAPGEATEVAIPYDFSNLSLP